MRYKTILFLLLSLLCITTTAQAALELELTQGIEGALPIAILPFTGQIDANNHNIITNVIRADLENSGRFRLITSNKTTATDEKNINYTYWRHQGADNVLLGNIKKTGFNHYQVDVKLLDTLDNNHVLFSKQYTIPSQRQRPLAHHISDIIYQQLTGEPGVFSTRIAYIVVKRRRGKIPQHFLEVADADGYNPQTILASPEPIMSPAWSPDGKKIAYVSFEKTRSQIFIADVASGERQLVSSFAGINGAPAWSPDGKKLALVLSKTGNPKIYILDLASKHLQQMTHGVSIDTEPSWAPAGKSLIFTSDRGGSPQIYQLNLSSGRIQRVSFAGNYNARASLTSDGKSMVMLHRNGGFNIAVQDMNNGNLRVLTNVGQNESPSLSPNGKMILYASHYGGNGVLSVVSTDGRVRLRLPSREGDVQEPAWAPFNH